MMMIIGGGGYAKALWITVSHSCGYLVRIHNYPLLKVSSSLRSLTQFRLFVDCIALRTQKRDKGLSFQMHASLIWVFYLSQDS